MHHGPQAGGTPAPSPQSSPAPRRKSPAASSSSSSQPPAYAQYSDDPNRPWWLQLNLPKAQALAPIAGMGDGAFVVRSSESRPECLVLSYKFRNQIIYELIRYFGGADGGYSLECAPEKRFLTLQELISHYEV